MLLVDVLLGSWREFEVRDHTHTSQDTTGS